MSTDTGTFLRVARLVNATPDRVFRAWTDPADLVHWSSPEGVEVDDVQVDLTVGGRYRIRMRDPQGKTFTAFGVYREIDRPHRLVYTWDWEDTDHPVGETIVTVAFTAAGTATEVVLTHERFPDTGQKDGHEQGWVSCLSRLERWLST
jgi:uncharacterized protein YndB with AHSA1/START domain